MNRSSRLPVAPGWVVALVLTVALSAIVGFVVGRSGARREVQTALRAFERRVDALEKSPAGARRADEAPAASPAPTSAQRNTNQPPDESGTKAPAAEATTHWIALPIVPLPPPAPLLPVATDAGLAAQNDGGTAAAVELEEPASDETTAEPPPEPEEEPPVRCGATWCSPGLVCCNADCGLCAPPGVACSQRMCGSLTAPVSVLCGMSTCNVGYVCCNPSCGTCVPLGASCDQRPCETSLEFPTVEMCGMTTCNTGFECCNPSCGLCVRPGEQCSKEACGW